MNLYTILDTVANEYGPVFEAGNHGVAKRAFRQMLSKEVTHPDEYSLYCIGEVDKKSLKLTNKIEVVCNGDSAVPQNG